MAAHNAWAALNAGAHSAGTWQLIGPSKATYPGVLNSLGDGAEYVAAGRVTAIAIGPTCSPGARPIYVAAAGGGIWRTSDGLAGHPNWQFVSGSFGTNAIGSLIPEGSLFYPPVIADPNSAKAGTIFQGSLSVWRTQDWGGSQAFLEANCAEFTTSFADPNCGDFQIIGDGVPSTRLTSAAWGTRSGGAIVWLARAPQNTGTMWAATTGARVFITDNANDPAASVHWNRLDDSLASGSATPPQRVITSIYVDPTNANHAWISYSGYNINTPTQPGHVFDVLRTGSTAKWTDLSYNLEDLPVTAVVRDDVTGDLYAASDFGVMRLANGSTTWTAAGTGLPNIEVPGLTIIPGARLLYAATHGRSAWLLPLP